MAINKYPWTDFNGYNLDWIIRKIKKFEKSLTDYEALHSITFGGDWDISKSYTQWTIVSDPATHNGYLSLKAVPYNVQITNEEYWLKIADYTTGLAAVNGRVDNVENDLNDNVKPDIEDLKTDVTNIENDLNDNVKPDIENLKTAVQNTENELNDSISPAITALQNAVTALKGRKIIIFGDSYFRTPAVSGGNTVKYYLDAFLSGTNIEFEINAQGGESFGDTGSYAFVYDVNNYVSLFDPAEVTDIFFCGGYNDRIYTGGEIESGIVTAFAAARAKYPNAKLHIGHFGWCSFTSGSTRSQIVNYSIPGYQLAAKYGGAYMTNSEFTMHDYSLFWTDQVHPTSEGAAQIAKQLVQYIFSGTCDVHYRIKGFEFNTADGPTAQWIRSTDSYGVYSQLDNDVVKIIIPDVYIEYDSAFNLTHNIYTSLLNLTDVTAGTPYKQYFIGNYSNFGVMEQFALRGNFTCRNNGVDTFPSFGDCSFLISEGNLKVNPHKMNNALNGYDDPVNVIGLNIVGQAIMMPTLMC